MRNPEPHPSLVAAGIRGRLAHWGTMPVFEWIFKRDTPNIINTNAYTGLRHTDDGDGKTSRIIVARYPL